MVLEVQTDTRQIHNGLYADSPQLLWVSHARALEDKRRGKCSTRHNDLLPGPEGSVLWRTTSWFGGDRLDAYGTAILNNHLVDLGVAREVKVGVNSTSGVYVRVGRVRSTAGVPVDPLKKKKKEIS